MVQHWFMYSLVFDGMMVNGSRMVEIRHNCVRLESEVIWFSTGSVFAQLLFSGGSDWSVDCESTAVVMSGIMVYGSDVVQLCFTFVSVVGQC